ncbi:MAG: class I SAM-dependent methyltransferase [Dehalococcoidia bacterium]
MPKGWVWDPSLFGGSARHYRRGRLPYPPGLDDAFAGAADLSGTPRLIDVGCGPGTVALILADLFAEIVGVDPDAEMLAEAAALASARAIAHARWVCLRAEALPAGLGRFRYATFAQSFHWMERERVARTTFDMLDPGGAFVHVNTMIEGAGAPVDALPHPPPPSTAIRELAERFLGPARRAGQGVLRFGTPGDEWSVLRAASFQPPQTVRVDGGQPLERTADDVVANVFSSSSTAPHLFGDRLDTFERELRGVLAAAAPDGLFSERVGDLELVFYRRPA